MTTGYKVYDMSKMISLRLPEDLVAWVRLQGEQTAVIRGILEAAKAGSPEPTKNRPVRTKTVKVWEDGNEYEREVPIS